MCVEVAYNNCPPPKDFCRIIAFIEKITDNKILVVR